MAHCEAFPLPACWNEACAGASENPKPIDAAIIKADRRCVTRLTARLPADRAVIGLASIYSNEGDDRQSSGSGTLRREALGRAPFVLGTAGESADRNDMPRWNQSCAPSGAQAGPSWRRMHLCELVKRPCRRPEGAEHKLADRGDSGNPLGWARAAGPLLSEFGHRPHRPMR